MAQGNFRREIQRWLMLGNNFSSNFLFVKSKIIFWRIERFAVIPANEIDKIGYQDKGQNDFSFVSGRKYLKCPQKPGPFPG